MPLRREHSEAEIEAAVQVLSEPERLEQALESADWFGSAHRAEVLQAAGVADPDARLDAVQRLIAEETRVSMLIGVAVGYELAYVLNENRGDD